MIKTSNKWRKYVWNSKYADKLVGTCNVVNRKEFSSSAVRRPINVDSLTKWAEHISYDLRPDVRSIAPMLDMLGYDADSYPPDYSTMTFTAESLLRQAASRDRSTWSAGSRPLRSLPVSCPGIRLGYNIHTGVVSSCRLCCPKSTNSARLLIMSKVKIQHKIGSMKHHVHISILDARAWRDKVTIPTYRVHDSLRPSASGFFTFAEIGTGIWVPGPLHL